MKKPSFSWPGRIASDGISFARAVCRRGVTGVHSLIVTVRTWFARSRDRLHRAAKLHTPPWKLREGSLRRRLLVSMVLGVVLTPLCFLVYTRTVSLPDPPVVTGAGELYLTAPADVARLRAEFDLTKIVNGRTPVTLTLTFYTAKPDQQVSWALVLTGDARPVDAQTAAETTPGVQVTSARVGTPPFTANPKDVPADVFHGVAATRFLQGHSVSVQIIMAMPVAVATSNGTTQSVSLPRLGVVSVNPAFAFPQDADAFDLGIGGEWHRPSNFAVQVDAGPNPVGERLDIVTPDLTDPTLLSWTSDESVQAIVQRTSLRRESRQQTIVFVLGAVVGAVASVLLAVVEALLSSVQRRVDAEPPPAQFSGPAPAPPD